MYAASPGNNRIGFHHENGDSSSGPRIVFQRTCLCLQTRPLLRTTIIRPCQAKSLRWLFKKPKHYGIDFRFKKDTYNTRKKLRERTNVPDELSVQLRPLLVCFPQRTQKLSPLYPLPHPPPPSWNCSGNTNVYSAPHIADQVSETHSTLYHTDR